jgi:excisionase family DNA binding protein
MTPTNFCGTSLAAKKLNLSVGTIQALVEKNVLQAWKTDGGHRRISMQSIADFLKRRGPGDRQYRVLDDNYSDRYSPLKVLVVDESSDTHDQIQSMRLGAGNLIESVWIPSALKALSNLKEIQPDILIADLSMTNVDVYEFLRIVRADHLPSILGLVGLNIDESTNSNNHDALPAGTALVKKPVHIQWLHGYFSSKIHIPPVQLY